MHFISGISLICFAASYGVAWALELSQAFRPSTRRKLLMFAFVVAGLLAHTLYLGHRALERSASPLSSRFDWCLVAAWLLAAIYLYLAYYYPKTALGLYMLPLVLVLIGAAALADRTPISPDSASRAWGMIHGVFLLLGTVAVMVGFGAGVMYLVLSRRLKLKRPRAEGLHLPALERLAKVNSRSIILSALLVGAGVLAGAVLSIITAGGARDVRWSDPVIGSSLLMLAWLSAAAVFNAAYRPVRQGRKVAYLTIVSFVFLLVALATLLWVDNQHGTAGNQAGNQAQPSAQAAEPQAAGGRS